jgi:hypothetical protein
VREWRRDGGVQRQRGGGARPAPVTPRGVRAPVHGGEGAARRPRRTTRAATRRGRRTRRLVVVEGGSSFWWPRIAGRCFQRDDGGQCGGAGVGVSPEPGRRALAAPLATIKQVQMIRRFVD